MNYFCTLFNQLYLSRGLALLSSLERSTKVPYRIFVLAMDDLTAEVLGKMDLPNVQVIQLGSFETLDLLQVKAGRTIGEYCWTCTPAIIEYCLKQFSLTECTYLDADLYFFNDPQILLNEVRNSGKSVLITPHNYTPHFDQAHYSGYYCVQFMYFKNDAGGLEVLRDWRSKCIEWCFHRLEDGKLGDQKYLDQWPKDFPAAVHDLVHMGAAAPWNIQKYYLEQEGTQWFLRIKTRREELIFYHFHSLCVLDKGEVFYGAYPLAKEVVEVIYVPYVQEMLFFDQKLIRDFKMGEVLQSRISMDRSKYFNLKFELRTLFWKFFYFWFKI